MNEKILDDFIHLYRNEIEKREEAESKRAEEQRLENEKSVRLALDHLGLTAERITSQHAYIRYRDELLHFVFLNWKHGQTGFYRVLDEKCPACGQNHITSQMYADEYNIGLALVDPQQTYHDCPNWMATDPSNAEASQTETMSNPTPTEKFIAALDEYILNVMQREQG